MADEITDRYLRRARKARSTLNVGAAIVILAGLLSIFGVPIDPASTPQAIRPLVANSPAILGAGGLFLIISAGRRIRSTAYAITRDRRAEVRHRAPIRSLRWWMILLAVAAVAGATWAALNWLLHEADAAPVRATARIDAIRTSMTVAAGLGAGLALALTTRRQWLAERAQGHTEDDTADRRVTELYTMAVGQLGSDNAAVRVGGLYALERLAQDNASHRQTIVEVICGYLRISDNTLRNPYKAMTADASIADGRGTLSGAPDRRTDRDVAELQVRLTAERILTTHLQPDRSWADIPHNPKFWSNIDLDLSGANLVDFNLHNCQVANANFRNATFAGTTDFGGIRFERHADFTGTEFLGDADFSLAEFLWHATFGQAHFGEDTSFEWAELCGRADFHNCIFGGTSNFDRAQFNRHATFGEATFYSLANFTQAQFSESVTFTRVTFHGRAIFTDAQLAQQTNRSGPVFQSARFGQGVRLGDSQTTHSTRLDHAPSWVRTCLHGAAARTDIPSQETRIWFPGWSVGDAPAKQPDDSPGTWRHLQSHYPESLPESELGS